LKWDEASLDCTSGKSMVFIGVTDCGIPLYIKNVRFILRFVKKRIHVFFPRSSESLIMLK
jgi:hypothetical protein